MRTSWRGHQISTLFPPVCAKLIGFGRQAGRLLSGQLPAGEKAVVVVVTNNHLDADVAACPQSDRMEQ